MIVTHFFTNFHLQLLLREVCKISIREICFSYVVVTRMLNSILQYSLIYLMFHKTYIHYTVRGLFEGNSRYSVSRN